MLRLGKGLLRPALLNLFNIGRALPSLETLDLARGWANNWSIAEPDDDDGDCFNLKSISLGEVRLTGPLGKR